MKDLTLLVVEPSDTDFGQFCRMLEGVRRGLLFQIALRRVTRVGEAEQALPGADLVLATTPLQPEPGLPPILADGMLLIDSCLRNKRPVAWVACVQDLDPHSLGQACCWGRERGIELIHQAFPHGSGVGSDRKPFFQASESRKPWLEAFYALLAFAVGLKRGEYLIDQGIAYGRLCREMKRYGLHTELTHTAFAFLMGELPSSLLKETYPVALLMEEEGIRRGSALAGQAVG